MSLDKAIAHGRERRRPYYRAGAVDRSCRPGGSCPYCRQNRLYATRKAQEAWEAERRRVALVGGFWRLLDDEPGLHPCNPEPFQNSSKIRQKSY